MAKFGTLSVYEEMAGALNTDPTWAEKGSGIDARMVFEYGPPVDKGFFVHFESGKVHEVQEVPVGGGPEADFRIIGTSDVWRDVLSGRLSPTTAMTTGKLKVKGKLTRLLKSMDAFSYVLGRMVTMPIEYE